MQQNQQKLQSSQVPLSKILLTNWLYYKKWVHYSTPKLLSNSNLHSCMRNKQWIFYNNLSLFDHITNLWIVKMIALKAFTSIWGNRASRNFITASRVYSRMQETIKNLQLYNYQQIQLLNNTVFIWLTVMAF